MFEGITSYYQELMLLRSGVLGRRRHSCSGSASSLTRVYRTPGRLKQSLAESSFDAWDILYRPEPNHPNTSISYYTKGALVALALDLEAAAADDGRRTSLDDRVRELWQRYGARGVGVPEDGFEALAIELGGADLAPFFDAAVRGTADLPLARAARRVRRPARAARGDRRRRPRRHCRAPATAKSLALGVALREREDGSRAHGACSTAAPRSARVLQPGDVLIALDRLKVSERNLRRRLARFEAGERVTASVLSRRRAARGGARAARRRRLDTCYLVLDVQADAADVRAPRKHGSARDRGRNMRLAGRPTVGRTAR